MAGKIGRVADGENIFRERIVKGSIEKAQRNVNAGDSLR